MPRKYKAGTFQPAPYYRWQKFSQGCFHRITCAELGLDRSLWTKEGSYQAANLWWENKVAVLASPEDRLEEEIAAQQSQLEKAEIVQAVEHIGVKQVVNILQEQEGKCREDALGSVREAYGLTPNADANKWLEQYLTLLRVQLRPKSYSDIAYFFKQFAMPAVYDEAAVTRFFTQLATATYVATAKQKRWSMFKRYVNWLADERHIARPSNLNSRLMKFKITAKKIQEFDPKLVKMTLAALKPRLRLYGLLALNAGMTQADIAQLRHTMIDWKRGTLTRKRVKTADHSNVPTVTYVLWPETFRLLKKLRSSHPDFILTSKAGTPLMKGIYRDGKAVIYDTLARQWRRAKTGIQFKAFRSIGATTLAKSFPASVSLYLGHSPQSIADRHYVAPSQEAFDTALAWLGKEFGM